MKQSKIKFVRLYCAYGHDWCNIIYRSNRVVTLVANDMPSTAKNFVAQASKITEQYDRVFKRTETIYEA